MVAIDKIIITIIGNSHAYYYVGKKYFVNTTIIRISNDGNYSDVKKSIKTQTCD